MRPSTIIIALLVSIVTLAASLAYGYGYRSPYLINLVYPQPIYQPNYIPSYTYCPGYYNRPFYSGYYW